MSVSMRLFKRVVVVVFSLCVVLAPIAVMGLAASILQPKVDMIQLYRVSDKATPWGFAFLFVYLVLGAALTVFCNRLPKVHARLKSIASVRTRSGISEIAWRVGWVVCMAVFLHSFLNPSRYVHPEGSNWISTGRAGPWVVSEQIAKGYLWSGIEWCFLIVFTGAWVLARSAQDMLRAVRLVEESDSIDQGK